jgi:hypothetical protein
MPAPDSSNLLSLIRLLDNDLSSADAIRLRERMAEELELAEQYRRLTNVLRQTLSPDELLQHASTVDPVAIADFIDGGMSESERAAFEAGCWKSESLLHEVVVTWRAEFDATTRSVDAAASDRARSVVRGLFGVSPTHPAINVESQDEALNPEPARNVLPVVVVDEPAVTHRSPRRESGVLIVVAGIVLAVVVGIVQFFGWPGGDQTALPDRPDRQDEQQRDEQQRDNMQPIVSQDGSDSPRQRNDESPVPDPNGQQPDSTPIVRNDKPSGTNLVPQAPNRPREVMPVPDSPPVIPESERIAIVEWSDVRGIAGVKDSAAAIWSGVHHRAGSASWMSDRRTQLMTLAQSRVTGTVFDGTTLIADTDSLIEVAAMRTADSAPAAAPAETAPAETAPQLIPVYRVQSGRLAITGLRDGQRLQVVVNEQFIEVEATDNNTTVAVERLVADTVLATYVGEVRIDGQVLTRRMWGRLNSLDELTTFRPQRPVNWYAARASSLPTSLSDPFNNSADLLQEAARVRQSGDPETALVATQLTLQCSAANDQPISQTIARQIAASSNEAHRQAMVQWLVTRFRQNPVTGEADLRLICRAQQADLPTTTAMTGWFLAAAEGRRPTATQLTELIRLLQDTSPVFTRQCSKFFLQQIIGDPLSEYDPSAPSSRAVLSTVSQKVRAWQQANP